MNPSPVHCCTSRTMQVMERHPAAGHGIDP
jgi:hypothetical protein